MTPESKIEGYLFFKAEPVKVKDIVTALNLSEEEVKSSIEKLKEDLSGRGVRVVFHDDKVMLGTPPEMSEFFEKLQKEELQKELSKAALETISIVMYRDGVTRSEINFIRGVNSGFILRMLEVRGLVEKETSKQDSRMYVYKPTLELLSFMGVSSAKELPEFEKIKNTLEEKLVTGLKNNEEA